VLCSSQDHLGTGICDLDHPILACAKNINNWHARKGDLQCAFPLHVPIVLSSTLVVTTDNEHLSYGGFSLGETIHFGSPEFIIDSFSSLSHSPKRDGSDVITMG
jgi:hypothetical protein